MMSAPKKQTPKKLPKPKDYAKPSTSKMRGGDLPEYPGRECVLSFPLLKTADNDMMLPRYTEILNRSEKDGVGMEDLDALQLELEALLSAVVVRSRVLKEEINALNSAEEKLRFGDRKGKISFGHTHKSPLSPGKRNKQQERPMKKLKEMGAKSRGREGGLTPLPIKFTKVKTITPASTSRPLPNILLDHDHNEQSRLDAPKVVLPKNDTPNKFWLSVEPYCAEIVGDDIRLLDDLINEHENDSEYQKVPPLGRHYSLRWAQEDMEEHSESNASKVKLRPSSHLMDGGGMKRQEQVNAGPLTQRLLSCLMEENIMIPPSQEHLAEKRCRGGENTKPSRNLTATNSSSLERRVRKELEEQGILDPSEQKDPADDEILAELRRCQSELKVITTHNIQNLKRLRKLASEEMNRQDLKKQLQSADNDVLDIYRKITASKQKKKSPSKEEIAQAWTSLKERERLIRQIDNM